MQKDILIDEKFRPFLELYNWSITKSPGSSTGYAYTSIDGKVIYMHRLLSGAGNSMDVDHINNNGLDNRLQNLRVATRSQNKFNSKMYKNNKSGYKGVCYDKSKKKWAAQIAVHGDKFRIGRFKSKVDAAFAYDIAALKLHGEFASTNFIKFVR